MSGDRDIDSVVLARRVRRHVLDMTHRGNSSHVASALSITDILAVLYASVLRVQPSQPDWPGRDRFVLSKGHAGASVYATLAECGFFDVSRLDDHCRDGSLLSGHVSHKGVPGVELSTGSLGHGLPICAGLALAAKLDDRSSRVFCLLSDGECDEGSVWEAALFAAHNRLSQLCAIIDYNGLQSLGTTEDTIRLEPLAEKWRAFGWSAIEVDGHDHPQLRAVLPAIDPDKPSVVLAHTTKGKGVTFMENSVLWHYRSPQGEDYERACRQLGSIQ
ncbi:MAG TPA: transketolase [Acidimicrobiales bacterium]|jgi:transketolase|nr:transketolase [Acidimicrobiales bacterium]